MGHSANSIPTSCGNCNRLDFKRLGLARLIQLRKFGFSPSRHAVWKLRFPEVAGTPPTRPIASGGGVGAARSHFALFTLLSDLRSSAMSASMLLSAAPKISGVKSGPDPELTSKADTAAMIPSTARVRRFGGIRLTRSKSRCSLRSSWRWDTPCGIWESFSPGTGTPRSAAMSLSTVRLGFTPPLT